jgi:putative tryptophan/tyrosine transport system substrate-binding protein
MKGICLAAAAAFIGSAVLVGAQAQDATVPRVGLLLGASAQEAMAANVRAFGQALVELGYSEGKSITIEPAYAPGEYRELAERVRELVQRDSRVIVVFGFSATSAALNVTKTVPLVMVASGDPVGRGLVASLSHPGGNLTGIALINDELVEKRIEILKEIVPSVRHLGVVFSSRSAAQSMSLKNAEKIGAKLDITVHAADIQHADGLGPAFANMAENGVHAYFLVQSTMLANHFTEIAALAGKHRLPGIGWTRPFAAAGGLVSYGPNWATHFRRAATYVDRILKGAKPGDLPIEQPTTFEFVVNTKTARDLGILLPSSILARADEVID